MDLYSLILDYGIYKAIVFYFNVGGVDSSNQDDVIPDIVRHVSMFEGELKKEIEIRVSKLKNILSSNGRLFHEEVVLVRSIFEELSIVKNFLNEINSKVSIDIGFTEEEINSIIARRRI